MADVISPISSASGDPHQTRVDRWVDWAKNHKVLSVVILLSLVLGGAASVTDAIIVIAVPIVSFFAAL